jgi:bifunctional non-homologous end joining protein LigD
MGLNEYKKKRSFEDTPEPTGGSSSKHQLVFVVQKHAASRLHYDFRLEMQGVLKSWAVPKGPSLNPADKRLAMLVEDHPFDYKDFEGIIPKGNYGAGTVIVWDEGTYEPLEKADTKSEQERILLKGFHAGQVKFRMYGKKLKGEFVLVRTSWRGENTWLLIKHRDEFASTEDVTLKDKSAVSGKTLEQVANAASSRRWGSNRNADGTLKAEDPEKKVREKKELETKVAEKKKTAAPRKTVAAKKVAPKKAVKKKSIPLKRSLLAKS